jgi:hypothetical protein
MLLFRHWYDRWSIQYCIELIVLISLRNETNARQRYFELFSHSLMIFKECLAITNGRPRLALQCFIHTLAV